MEKNSEGARFGWALRKEVLLALAVAGLVAYGLYHKYRSNTEADKPVHYDNIKGEGGIGR